MNNECLMPSIRFLISAGAQGRERKPWIPNRVPDGRTVRALQAVISGLTRNPEAKCHASFSTRHALGVPGVKSTGHFRPPGETPPSSLRSQKSVLRHRSSVHPTLSPLFPFRHDTVFKTLFRPDSCFKDLITFPSLL